MPKIDFNVPVLQQDGSPQMRTKIDRTKIKVDKDGRQSAEPIIDSDGYIVQEPATLAELLSSILDNVFIGEETLKAEDRIFRGKLCRKIADRTPLSRKNYYGDELQLLRDCMMKAQASPMIFNQVEELISNGQHTKEEAIVTGETLLADKSDQTSA